MAILKDFVRELQFVVAEPVAISTTKQITKYLDWRLGVLVGARGGGGEFKVESSGFF